jgi:hypothetical protein
MRLYAQIVRLQCLLLCLAGILALPLPLVAAQSSCALVRAPDGVMAYDANRNGVADREGDNWLLSQNGVQSGSLLAFSRAPTGLAAYLYPAEASQRLDPCAIDPQQASDWRLQLVARDGSWFLPDGKPNWNLDLRLQAMFTFRDDEFEIVLIDHPRERPKWWLASMPDAITISTWDTDRNGVPDLERDDMNVAGPYPLLIANRDPNWQPEPGPLLPALGPLAVLNPDGSDLQRLRHLIPTRRLENGYSLVFTRKQASDRPVYATENPFAFYDLQGDKDGEAELKLRAVTEDIAQDGSGISTYNEFRYSWAQTSNGQQYRLYVIGSQPNNIITEYPDELRISHLAYEDLPSYVLNTPWLGAAFAEDEELGTRSYAEGIYENLLYTSGLRARLLSLRNNKQGPYLPIFRGLREEYNFSDYNRTATLSFNPIDQRLHLLGAREGVIIYEASSEGESTQNFDFSDRDLTLGSLVIGHGVRYFDSNGDGLIDTWRIVRDNELTDGLYVRGNTALFANGSGVQLKRLGAAASLNAWQLAPPATPAEWQALNERLLPVERRPLHDLAALFADLPGEAMMLPKASLTSVSPQQGKLVAQLQLSAASELPAALSTTNTTMLPAASYSLVADRQGMQLVEPTAPGIAIEPLEVRLPDSAPIANPGGLISLRAHNRGTLDATGELVISQHASSGITTLYTSTVTIGGLDHFELNLPWTPNSISQQSLRATFSYASPAGAQVARVELPLNNPPATPDLQTLHLPAERSVMLLLLAALVLGVVLAGLINFIRSTGGSDAEQP